MAGDAYDTIKRFWDVQDSGDYCKLVGELFTDDAVLVDPIYGTFTGAEAITGFMAEDDQRDGCPQASASASSSWPVTTRRRGRSGKRQSAAGNRSGVGVLPGPRRQADLLPRLHERLTAMSVHSGRRGLASPAPRRASAAPLAELLVAEGASVVAVDRRHSRLRLGRRPTRPSSRSPAT